MELDNTLKSKIDGKINDLIDDFKRKLLYSSGSFQKRGLWDRFKNWMSNIAYGRYKETNPYYFTNRLGDLGGASVPKKENYEPLFKKRLTIEQYKNLAMQFEKFENYLSVIFEENIPKGGENIQIVRMLDDLAKNLKDEIYKIVKSQKAEKTDVMPPEKEKPKTAKTTDVMPPEKSIPSKTTDDTEKINQNLSRIKKNIENLNKAFEEKGMPENVYNRINSNLKNMLESPLDVDEEKLTKIEDEISGISTIEDNENEEKFPFNFLSNKNGLKNIKKELKNNHTYKIAIEEWNNTSLKRYVRRFKNLNIKINKILENTNTDVTSNEEKTIDRFKIFISHILTEEEESKEILKFESYISPLSCLNVKEKTAYIKKLILKN